MKKLTRQEAVEQNLKYYFTGIVCPNGHISKRSVHNCTCYECKCEARTKADTPNKKVTRSKKHYQNNKKKIATRTKTWQQNNRGKYNALLSKYRAKKLKATPSWSDLQAITEFYKNCPIGMVVDHIIPLQGKKVSGFHVLENLQYLTPQENSNKNNTFEPIHLVKSQ